MNIEEMMILLHYSEESREAFCWKCLFTYEKINLRAKVEYVLLIRRANSKCAICCK